MSIDALRDRLRGGEAVYGGWSTIPDVLSVRSLAAAGLDYVVIDLQHGNATARPPPARPAAPRRPGPPRGARAGPAPRPNRARAPALGGGGVTAPSAAPANGPAGGPGGSLPPPPGSGSGGGPMATADPFCV